MPFKEIRESPLWFPSPLVWLFQGHRGYDATSSTLNVAATGEKFCCTGYVRFRDNSNGPKTLSSSGGKIHFATGTVVWANSATVVRIGLQDVDTSVIGGYPDETFDTHADITPSGGAAPFTLSSGAWHTVSMTSGTKSLSHGEEISVVFDMTTRGGSDIFRATQWGRANSTTIASPPSYPIASRKTGSDWVAPVNTPTIVIEFDDGTFATFEETLPAVQVAEQWNVGGDPNERALLFRTAFDVSVRTDYLAARLTQGPTTRPVTWRIYSNPLGTPSLMYTVEEQVYRGSGNGFPTIAIPRGTTITFAAGTDYAIGLRPLNSGTGGNVTLNYLDFRHASDRAFLPNGVNLRKGSRNWATESDPGTAFTEDTSLVPRIGFAISSIDFPEGGEGSKIVRRG